MSVAELRQRRAARARLGRAPAVSAGWITTVDHKRIGLLYF